MATAKLEKLSEDFLHCSLCLESFRDPRSLGCLHTFCCPCLVYYAQSQAAGPGARLQCPVCREETTLPTEEGVLGLKSNYFVTTLQEFVGRAAETESCGLCENVGVFHCVECESVLCQNCMHSHSTKFKEHTMSQIDNPQATPAPERTTKCERHAEPFQFYCTEFKCDQPLCSSCCKEHESHKIIDITEQNESCRLRLSKALMQLTTMESLQHNLQNICTKQQLSLATNRDEVLSCIDMHIENIIQKVEEAREVLKYKAAKMFDEENHEVYKQIEEVSGLCTSASYMKHFIQQLLEKGSPADLVSIAQVALSRAEEVLEKGNKERLLKETVVAYSSRILEDALLQAWIGDLTKNENIEIFGDNNHNELQTPQLLEKPVLKKIFGCGAPGDKSNPKITRICEGPEGEIACYDRCNRRLKVFSKEGTLQFTSELKSLPSSALHLEWNSELEAYVLEYKDETFFKVTERGIVKKICVSCVAKKNEKISIILEEHDGPNLIKVWAPELNPEFDEYSNCFHVSSTSNVAKVSPSGEIIVLSEDEKCIWRFDSEGKLLNHVLCQVMGCAYSPCNVYFDRYSYVYIIAYRDPHHVILILNTEGDHLQTIRLSSMLCSNIIFSLNDEMIFWCWEGDIMSYQLYA